MRYILINYDKFYVRTAQEITKEKAIELYLSSCGEIRPIYKTDQGRHLLKRDFELLTNGTVLLLDDNGYQELVTLDI